MYRVDKLKGFSGVLTINYVVPSLRYGFALIGFPHNWIINKTEDGKINTNKNH